jgi:hypothetical protein
MSITNMTSCPWVVCKNSAGMSIGTLDAGFGGLQYPGSCNTYNKPVKNAMS